jgi:hypothetical protein
LREWLGDDFARHGELRTLNGELRIILIFPTLLENPGEGDEREKNEEMKWRLRREDSSAVGNTSRNG